ncbi:MAG: glycosyltransferase family 4 protein [Planctomycetes bacterium]|nr:glycosyltransferase family 4 protein [Planctomycetota bacterium]
MNTDFRPRVLQLSYSCGPDRGSEPGIGWNRAVGAARFCDVWVMTCEQDWGPTIRDYLATHGAIPGLQFAFVSHSLLELLLQRIPGLYYVAYNLWHRRAFRAARELHERLQFHLAHQLTFCGFREPGYLWRLPIPFVWGPFGGTQNYPWRFLGGAGWSAMLKEAIRTLINGLQLRFSRRVRNACHRAGAVLVANSTVQKQFTRLHPCPTTVLTDIGLASVADGETDRRQPANELRILWSGVIEHRKALEILLEALATLPADVSCELRVLGSGPRERRMRQLARRRGIDHRVTWLGWLPHAEAIAQFAWADVFLFTSLRDTTGTVLVEALGAGVPVVTFDHQGAADVVDATCGVKVAVTNRPDAVRRFCQVLTDLARHPSQLAALKRGCLQRAARYVWASTTAKLIEVYRQVLAARGCDWMPRETSPSTPFQAPVPPALLTTHQSMEGP